MEESNTLGEKNTLGDEKFQYLQMIQNTIDRMSTTSAIFKGFCATIVAGIFSISFKDVNNWILMLMIIPILCFLFLDIYYLRLEKRFRVLYNLVRIGKKKVDFDLTPPATKDLKIKDAGLWFCFKSPSIYLFYIPIMVTIFVTIYLKFSGVI